MKLNLTQLQKYDEELTTALKIVGWVPETSRSFHNWQPAPRWRLLPWLAQATQP